MDDQAGYELLDDFHAEFIRRTKLNNFPKFGKGHKEVKRNGPTPRITFVDTGGELVLGGTEKTGGAEGDIASDDTVWDLYIWTESLEQCRELFYELLRAIRDTIGTENLLLEGAYQLDEVSDTSGSRLLMKPGLIIRTGVAARTGFDFTLVSINQFTSEVGDLNAIPEDPTYQNIKTALGGEGISIIQTSPE